MQEPRCLQRWWDAATVHPSAYPRGGQTLQCWMWDPSSDMARQFTMWGLICQVIAESNYHRDETHKSTIYTHSWYFRGTSKLLSSPSINWVGNWLHPHAQDIILGQTWVACLGRHVTGPSWFVTGPSRSRTCGRSPNILVTLQLGSPQKSSSWRTFIVPTARRRFLASPLLSITPFWIESAHFRSHHDCHASRLSWSFTNVCCCFWLFSFPCFLTFLLFSHGVCCPLDICCLRALPFLMFRKSAVSKDGLQRLGSC